MDLHLSTADRSSFFPMLKYGGPGDPLEKSGGRNLERSIACSWLSKNMKGTTTLMGPTRRIPDAKYDMRCRGTVHEKRAMPRFIAAKQTRAVSITRLKPGFVFALRPSTRFKPMQSLGVKFLYLPSMTKRRLAWHLQLPSSRMFEPRHDPRRREMLRRLEEMHVIDHNNFLISSTSLPPVAGENNARETLCNEFHSLPLKIKSVFRFVCLTVKEIKCCRLLEQFVQGAMILSCKRSSVLSKSAILKRKRIGGNKHNTGCRTFCNSRVGRAAHVSNSP